MFLYGKDRKKEEHTVKILFYDTKSYDKESFEAKAKDYPDIQIEYLKSELVPSTAKLAKDTMRSVHLSAVMWEPKRSMSCLRVE